MKKIIICFLLFFSISNTIIAQDYFTDLTSGTTPILFNGKGKALFSATINAGDNSIKTNFFRQYLLNSSWYKQHADSPTRHKDFFGWGVNTKAKTDNGLGSLFTSGQFSPDFSGGLYLAFSEMTWHTKTDKNNTNHEIFGQWAIILSSTLSNSKFQLYHEDSAFNSQLLDTNFNGNSLSISFVKTFLGGKNNILTGLSITVGRKNNYASLDKVEIKNDSIFSNGAGLTRRVQQINDDGYTYGTGNYKQYNNFNVRANVSFIPSALDYFMAFILYPSIDYSKSFSPKYNIGLSFAHLKDGSPAISDAAFYIELNDIANAAGKKGSFLKRTISVGVSTSLNIFTSSKQ